MNSSTNNKVSDITGKMKNTTIRKSLSNPSRWVIGSLKNISETTEEWSNSLIGKLIVNDLEIETGDVKEDLNTLWKIYKKKEVRVVEKHLYVCKLNFAKDMNDILKKSLWNV